MYYLYGITGEKKWQPMDQIKKKKDQITNFPKKGNLFKCFPNEIDEICVMFAET